VVVGPSSFPSPLLPTLCGLLCVCVFVCAFVQERRTGISQYDFDISALPVTFKYSESVVKWVGGMWCGWVGGVWQEEGCV